MTATYDKLLKLGQLARFKEKQDAQNEAKFADKASVAAKTDREMEGANGKALIFNESDGGGAKFEHSDGTMSFVGVNDGGQDGIAGQLYAVKKEGAKNVGTRLNLTREGFFYLPNSNSATYTAEDELATKGDVAAVVGGQGYQTAEDVSDAISAALSTVMDYKGSVDDMEALEAVEDAKAGDVYHVASSGTEYAWNGSEWEELGVTFDATGYVQSSDITLATDEDIDGLFADGE